VGEAAHLLPVVVDHQGLAGKRRIDKSWQDHAVSPVWRGPTTLKKRPTTTGKPNWRHKPA